MRILTIRTVLRPADTSVAPPCSGPPPESQHFVSRRSLRRVSKVLRFHHTSDKNHASSADCAGRNQGHSDTVQTGIWQQQPQHPFQNDHIQFGLIRSIVALEKSQQLLLHPNPQTWQNSRCFCECSWFLLPDKLCLTENRPKRNAGYSRTSLWPVYTTRIICSQRRTNRSSKILLS